MCRRKKTDNQENNTSHSTQKRKMRDNEEGNLAQRKKKKRANGKSCNEDSMGKPNNKEDKTTKKRQENIKNGL